MASFGARRRSRAITSVTLATSSRTCRCGRRRSGVKSRRNYERAAQSSSAPLTGGASSGQLTSAVLEVRPLPGGAWCPARRSGFLRHTARSAEGCCRQALTRFAAPRCAGPDRRARHQAVPLPGPSVRGRFTLACLDAGGVRERPNRHDWKSCVGKLTVGSNPTLSARFGQLRGGSPVASHSKVVGHHRGLTY